MIAKKIIRYYSDCGKGFWKKQQAIRHDKNCMCWSNPKYKSCLSCKHKNIINESNGMENEPQFLQTWKTNICENSESGMSAHFTCDYIRIYCQYYEPKKQINPNLLTK